MLNRFVPAEKDLLNGHNVVGDNAVRVFIGGQFSAENFKIVDC